MDLALLTVKILVDFKNPSNLAIAGSIVGCTAYYAENEAMGWSMPFFANSILGLFGIIAAKGFQQITLEESRSLTKV